MHTKACLRFRNSPYFSRLMYASLNNELKEGDNFGVGLGGDDTYGEEANTRGQSMEIVRSYHLYGNFGERVALVVLNLSM